MSKKDLIPFVATHPGEMIKDELRARGMSQRQLSVITGIKPSVISETINGKRNVSLAMAQSLERAFEIPADVWMNLQVQYNLDSANIDSRERIDKHASVTAKGSKSETVSVTIPVRDRTLFRELVRKFGWVCMF
ncbi:MAG: HigA family addiction module antidote protein [Bacteroidales bacterium]|nr:HigA family addiction module antidote protein [Bacteroidales bacterium]